MLQLCGVFLHNNKQLIYVWSYIYSLNHKFLLEYTKTCPTVQIPLDLVGQVPRGGVTNDLDKYDDLMMVFVVILT